MSVYRNAVFLIKGYRQFTNTGYNEAAKSFKDAEMDCNLSGKVVMITGANSGIGKSAATALAKKGAEIHMICRNLERGNSAKTEVIAESGNQKVYIHQLDLSETERVFQFAEEFLKSQIKLNVLVNNAGCMVNERKLIEVKTLNGSENLETNFATNTLGTYILTQALLPLLKSSDDPRVVTVSSGGMYTQKLSKDLQCIEGKFDGTMVYAQNKRQQVILTEEWAKLHPQVHFSCMHPGWADTPAVQTSMPEFHRKLKDKLRTPEQGADTIVWLAASTTAAVQHKSGQFFLDRKPQETHLPLAWTHESENDRKEFLANLQQLEMRMKRT